MNKRSVGPEKTDRISSLPDDIIHQFLGRSECPFKISAQLSVLSKRWNHIYHSCPTLILDGQSKQTEDFIAATEACKKLFQRRSRSSIPTETITIIEPWRKPSPDGFLDEIVDLTAKISPREVDLDLTTIHSNRYVIPRRFLICQRNYDDDDDDNQFFRRLTKLKLKECSFRAYQAIETPNFQGLGISLTELNLVYVSFPVDGILDAMISAACRLEKLRLGSIDGIKKFRVKDHPCLKLIAAKELDVEEFEIAGVDSLETLEIFGMRIGCFRVSSTPNLKRLDINEGADVEDLKNGNLLKFILDYPSLESIAYDGGRSVAKFKIFNTKQVQKVEFKWHNRVVAELDASELDGDFITSFVTALAETYNKHMWKVAPVLLAALTEFRVNCLWLTVTGSHRRGIKHVKRSAFSRQDGLLDDMLHACHPKFISFIGREDQRPNFNCFTALPVWCITNRLVERASCTVCGGAGEDCWNNQLKDVKTVTNGNIREDKLAEFSEDTKSSVLEERDQISFKLTWH
ncbi:hypothetical protein LINGRAHAP2_LOCUS28671 [Linum grandiflorum]